jgi:hypothetical protein
MIQLDWIRWASDEIKKRKWRNELGGDVAGDRGGAVEAQGGVSAGAKEVRGAGEDGSAGEPVLKG